MSKHLAIVLPLLVGVAFPVSARAHHTAGQGASEGLRTMAAAGGQSVVARQRVAWLSEIVRTSDEPSLNPSTAVTTSVLVSALVAPWISVGVQAPLLVVDEDAPGVSTKVGYGDTRLVLRTTFQQESVESDAEDPAASGGVTLGLDVTLPTRTIRYEVDPGRQYSLTPLVALTQRLGRWSGQALLLTPIEDRPAGTAFDVGVGGQVAFQLTDWWNLSAGSMAGIRVATRCTTPGGGSEWCSEGRVTERNRSTGSVRVDGLLGSTFQLARELSLYGGVQLPLTARRDFLVAASSGLYWTF